MSSTGGMKILWRTLLVALVLVFLVYGGLKTRNLVSGPKISVDNLVDGMTVSNDYITLTGTVRNTSNFSINGNPVPTDRTGAFSYQLLMPSGYSIIKLSAEDRFGKRTENLYRVIGPEVTMTTPPAPVEEETPTEETTTEVESETSPQ